MISTKQRAIAFSTIAIAVAVALFASLPMMAYAFWGGWGWGEYGGGWGVNRCAWFGCGVGSGGWFPWSSPTPAFNG